MRKSVWMLGAAVLMAAHAHTGVAAKDRDEDKAKDAEAASQDGPKRISAFVSGFERQDGLFPTYRDGKTGKVYMAINADQFGKDFIYFAYTENGPADTGHFRGNFRDNRVIVFNRRYDRVEIEAINTSYYFEPGSALARASSANIARAPLANMPIAAESEDGRTVLISLDDLLEKQTLHSLLPWLDPEAKPGQSFQLGELSADKTSIASVGNFPENTDIRVEYVFDNPRPANVGDLDVTDPRSVAVLVQHSFLAMPAAGFEPRADDFRVGYFTTEATDLTSASFTPYRDFINRWRLQKKDPSAKVSDPVTPITYWIENTTPVELRDVIRDAGLRWNEAFTAAGISNAIDMKIQPDDAKWDAGDVRYNTLRWTSSPNPPFGGYGPSFVNPRTGEILGADIMLEYVFLTNRIRSGEIYGTTGGEASPADEQRFIRLRGGSDCKVGAHLQANLMAAQMMTSAADVAQKSATSPIIRQALYYLILHEMGHTLGLNHNMRSSSTVPLASLGNPNVPPTNSVMDYPPANIAPPGEPQGMFFIDRPGAYDIWAIQYGYTPESSALPAILARSTEPALAFGNDADDVRSPGLHIDPRVMIDDLSDDPVAWALKRSALVDQTFRTFPARVLRQGQGYQALVAGWSGLMNAKAGAAEVASRWIGGVYNNRSVVGQPGATQLLKPVSAAEQRRALAAVTSIVLAPNAFAGGEDLLSRLQMQRRGFGAYDTNVDPQPHARALSMQRAVLDHLLHPSVLTRLTDTRRYGGDYPVSTYMAELTGKMFDADAAGAVNTYRQNLQIEYLSRLIGIASGAGGGVRQTPLGPRPLPGYDTVARSAVLASIARVKSIAVAPAMDAETRAHKAHMLDLIRKFERR